MKLRKHEKNAAPLQSVSKQIALSVKLRTNVHTCLSQAIRPILKMDELYSRSCLSWKVLIVSLGAAWALDGACSLCNHDSGHLFVVALNLPSHDTIQVGGSERVASSL